MSDRFTFTLETLLCSKIASPLSLEKCLSEDGVYLDTLQARKDFKEHFYEKSIGCYHRIRRLRMENLGKCGKVFLQCSIERHLTNCLFRLFGYCTHRNSRKCYLIETKILKPKEITYNYLMKLLDRENITLNVVGISTFGDEKLGFDTHHFPKIDLIVSLSCCLVEDINNNNFANVLKKLYVCGKRELNIREPQLSRGLVFCIPELGDYLIKIRYSNDPKLAAMIENYLGVINILIYISCVYTQACRHNKLGYFVENIPNIRQLMKTQKGHFEETLQFLSDENWRMYVELCRTYPWLPFRPPYMNRYRARSLLSFNNPEEVELTEHYFFKDIPTDTVD
ncbi:unnamed protein product [Dimorphilus gyrociliatus]|uniref:Uncharacterized protein n=1 Tax=Dimorphilus gyrociliatus TaxID=2664684 RepID=A0A7I8VE81_9ANNE|nr:unnamed protein product [Dimorphilus gyrociliatus]